MRTREPDIKTLSFEYYKNLWLLSKNWILLVNTNSLVLKTFPLLQKLRTQPATILSTLSKCAMPIEIDRIVTSQQSTLQSTHFIQLIQMCNANFLKFQTDITSNSILQKGQNLRYHPKMSAFGFFRVSSKETCETPCLSRPLRVGFGNPESFKISNLPCPVPAFTGFYLGFSGFREPCCTP